MTKTQEELVWKLKTDFEDGIREMIRWYLDQQDWWREIISGEYQDYYEKIYGDR